MCRLNKEKEQQKAGNPHLPKKRGRPVSEPRKRAVARGGGGVGGEGQEASDVDEVEAALISDANLQTTINALQALQQDAQQLQSARYKPILEALNRLRPPNADLQEPLPRNCLPLR